MMQGEACNSLNNKNESVLCCNSSVSSHVQLVIRGEALCPSACSAVLSCKLEEFHKDGNIGVDAVANYLIKYNILELISGLI